MKISQKMINEYLKNPTRYSALPLYKEVRFNNQDVDVVHDSDFLEGTLNNYQNHQRFFRLYFKENNYQNKMIDGYRFILCDIKKDIPEIKDFINRNYDNISISTKEINDMINDDVFDNNFWIWIIDDETKEKKALGISQVDHQVKEVVLDWIQVDNSARKLGLGSMLVSYLLKKTSDLGYFATVSGDYDNPSSPLKLYQKCGFKGNDLWHILIK